MDGPESTSGVEHVLSEVSLRRHIRTRRVFLDVAGPFPVAGPASWSNDWHVFRPCPFPHFHEGLDIFAPRGTPAVAVANGVVAEVIDDDVTGLGLLIDGPGGIQYLYAHLEAFGGGVATGARVTRGEIVGFVGNTGDAAGASTHLHFEVRPGGTPMPPKPLVDRWLIVELRRAKALLKTPRRDRVIPFWWKPLPNEAFPKNAEVIPASPAGDHAPARSSDSAAGPVGFLSALGAMVLVGVVLRRRRF
jgi:murein DD-endopeptidase MepM/ murein hydrolase activator NlpD